MDNRLKGLKKAMTTTVFRDVAFSEEQQQEVFQRLSEQQSDDQWRCVLEAIGERTLTGFEITEWLERKGTSKLFRSDGDVYAELHQLEQRQLLDSKWINERKCYFLTEKGLKQLAPSNKEAPTWLGQEVTNE